MARMKVQTNTMGPEEKEMRRILSEEHGIDSTGWPLPAVQALLEAKRREVEARAKLPKTVSKTQAALTPNGANRVAINLAYALIDQPSLRSGPDMERITGTNARVTDRASKMITMLAVLYREGWLSDALMERYRAM